MDKNEVKSRIKARVDAHVLDLVRELNGILRDARMWYGREEFGRSVVNENDFDDRNADRLVNYLFNDVDALLAGKLRTENDLGLDTEVVPG